MLQLKCNIHTLFLLTSIFVVLLQHRESHLELTLLENKLITRPALPITVLTLLLGICAVTAEAADVRQDAKAVDVLKQMAAYKTSLDQVAIKAVTLTDARLGGGLMVSNSEEVHVSISRPGSMQIYSFDGVAKKGLFFHEGLLTVFNSENMFYAQANVPKEVEAAMAFALDKFGVEAPMMDLLHRDASALLIGSDETILYLTDKSRIGGVDCHHLAIRGAEVDVQLWVQEGDRPLPRKIMITSKWEGGSPRFVANLSWDTDPKFEPDTFEFKAPEGATKIEFNTDSSQP